MLIDNFLSDLSTAYKTLDIQREYLIGREFWFEFEDSISNVLLNKYDLCITELTEIINTFKRIKYLVNNNMSNISIEKELNKDGRNEMRK